MATYRLLKPEEYPRLAAVFDELKLPAPRPGQDQVIVGEEDEKIIAATVVQMIPHVALWIDPNWKGKRDYETMAQMAEIVCQTNGLNGFAMTTDQDVVKSIARRVGMKDAHMSFFTKIFGGG